jgi:hypothetical protein
MGKQDGLIGELQGWPAAVANVRARVNAAEHRLSKIPGEMDALRGRVSGLDTKINSGLEKTQKSTRDLGTSLRGELANVRSDARERQEASQARMRDLEAKQQTQAQRTAELEREVTQLQSRIAGLRGDLNSASASQARETAQVRQDVQRAGARVEQVASYNNRPRDRFQVEKGATKEIAPGIMLHLTRVNTSHRRFDGWIQLVNDSARFVWLRDQAVLQTFAFYSGKNALRHDLVVTDLSPGGITGYLIYPRHGESVGAE